MNPMFQDIDADDEVLIAAAQETLKRCYHPVRHTVAAAVRCGSGKIYTGVDVDTPGYGPCAEPIAIGAAITAGEREIVAITAVCQKDGGYRTLPPCGNCRQLLFEYAPDAMVILPINGIPRKTQARNLLPEAYGHWGD